MTRSRCLLAVLATALAAAAPASAGRIAFLRGKPTAAGGEVYSISDRGGKERLVAGLTARNLGWSADGKQLALTQVVVKGKKESYYVWVVGAGGKGLHRVTKDGKSGFVAWARERLVVNQGGKLVVLATSGKLLGKLPATFASADELAWSRSGSRIAYTVGGRLFTADAHGRDKRVLTPATKAVAYPSWSPDGRRIAFAELDQKAVGQSPVETTSIWTVGVDGKGLHRVTGGNHQDAAPSWAPDGRRIAFMRSPATAAQHSDLWVVRADGGQPHELTRSPALDALPVWRG